MSSENSRQVSGSRTRRRRRSRRTTWWWNSWCSKMHRDARSVADENCISIFFYNALNNSISWWMSDHYSLNPRSFQPADQVASPEKEKVKGVKMEVSWNGQSIDWLIDGFIIDWLMDLLLIDGFIIDWLMDLLSIDRMSINGITIDWSNNYILIAGLTGHTHFFQQQERLARMMPQTKAINHRSADDLDDEWVCRSSNIRYVRMLFII